MRKAMLVFFVLVFMITPVFAEDKISVVADGAVLMDYDTGRVLWSKNPTKPLSMASTTKIMTAIIVLENANLDDTVIISKNASHAPDVQLNLKEGEEVKLGDLMYALMLESSNDAAVAIAEHVGGSVDNFCKMMTDKAKEIGANDTVFETPNGLDKGDHHSTALDMAIITRYALNIPKFVSIINTPSKTFSSNYRTYSVNNKNRLLTTYDGANGVKTGFTNKAGQCFVGAAKRGNMQLISVVLASGWGAAGKAQKWTDTKALLDYGFANFKYTKIISKGDIAGSILISRSKSSSIDLLYDSDLILPISDFEKDNISVVANYEKNYLAPVKKGIAIGTATIDINGLPEAKINLVTANSADRHDFETKLNEIIKYWLNLDISVKI